MVFDATLLNTQHYKIMIKGKWNNPGNGLVPSPIESVVAIEKGAFGLTSTTVANFTSHLNDLDITVRLFGLT